MNLVSVCAAAATVGVLTVVVVEAVPRWVGGAQDDLAASTLQVALREAQQRAVGGGKAMCVDVDQPAQTWTVVTGRCRPPRDGVTFFADGTATPRTVQFGADTIAVDSSGHVTRR